MAASGDAALQAIFDEHREQTNEEAARLMEILGLKKERDRGSLSKAKETRLANLEKASAAATLDLKSLKDAIEVMSIGSVSPRTKLKEEQAKREKEDREQKSYEEERKRREAAAERKRRDEERQQELATMAAGWARAEQIRGFVAAFLRSKGSKLSDRHEAWARWAMTTAEELDPLQQGDTDQE